MLNFDQLWICKEDKSFKELQKRIKRKKAWNLTRDDVIGKQLIRLDNNNNNNKFIVTTVDIA